MLIAGSLAALVIAAVPPQTAECPNAHTPAGRVSDFARFGEVHIEGDRKRLWLPFALPVMSARDARRELHLINIDFAWGRDVRLMVICAGVFIGARCPRDAGAALVIDGAAVELARAGDYVYALTKELIARISSATTVYLRLGGLSFELDEDDGVAKLRRIAPCLVARDAPPSALTSAAAAELAAKLANEECARVFKARPFSANDFVAEAREGRWSWGRIDPAGPGGFSAVVSFDLAGNGAEVKVSWDGSAEPFDR